MTLYTLRRREGLTQRQVADAIGVAESTYCLYEGGKRKPPVETVMALAKVLHFDWPTYYEEAHGEVPDDSEGGREALSTSQHDP